MNDGHFTNVAFEACLYNGIYLAEYTARMSSSPIVKAVGATALFLGNTNNQGMIRTADDHEKYLVDQVDANPNFSTNTATDPNTQFSFYYSAPGLAMGIANQAINSSTHIWPTTVTGGPMVGVVGFDNQPIPAIYAQGYLGDDGTPYLLITNKYREAVPVAIETNGSQIGNSLTVSYISNTDFTAENTAQDQKKVQIVNTVAKNPLLVGPYSVTRVEW